MKRWFSLLRVSIGLSPDIAWYLVLSLLLPILALAGAGIYWLWTQNLLTQWLLYWLAAVTTVLCVRFLLNRISSSNPSVASDAPVLPRLQAHSEWAPLDHQAWKQSQAHIDQALQHDPDWNTLKELAIEQHAMLGRLYFPKDTNSHLSFTVAELLIVLEVTSSRYRAFIQNNVPLAESINIGAITSLYRHKSTVTKGYRALNTARRIFRLTNPIAAAASEVRDHISGRVLNQASQKLQYELKRTLLEELAQVAIDLYSGRLKISDEELARYVSTAAIKDAERVAVPVETIRAVVIGQVNAGKSSLINALTLKTHAEQDSLPTTERLSTHLLQFEEGQTINLIDTPGIDGSVENHDLLLQEIINADVLIWVFKATQPGRSNDKELLNRLNQYLMSNTQKIPPIVVPVLSHIDRLRPVNEWHPPYSAAGSDQKSQNIQLASETISKLLERSDVVIPVSMPADRETYNIDMLANELHSLVSQASNVQLNRLRLEHNQQGIPWRERLRQAGRLSKVAAKSVRERLFDRDNNEH